MNDYVKKTKIYMDAEFTGLHKNTTLISICLISENDDIFYAEFTDYDRNQIDDWLTENVLANLFLDKVFLRRKGNQRLIASEDSKNIFVRGNTAYVKDNLEKYLDQFDSVEIWSDCLSYDWVLFCELWGGAFYIPKHIYYIPFDICTVFKEKGIDPDVSREEFAGESFDAQKNKHNSLHDTVIIKKCHEKLLRCLD